MHINHSALQALLEWAMVAFALVTLVTMLWFLGAVAMAILPRRFFRNIKRRGGVGLRLLGNLMQFALVVPLVGFAIIGIFPLVQCLILIPLMEIMALGIHFMGVQTIKDCDLPG